MPLRVTVNPDLCTGSGYCIRDLPQVFHEAPDGSSFVADDTLPADLEAAVREAEAICPSDAIEIHDD